MKHLWRKIVSVILALAMVVLCLPEYVRPVKTAKAAQGDPEVKYVDENGNVVTLAGSQYELLETTGTIWAPINDNRPRTWGVDGQTTYYVVGVNERSWTNDKRVNYGNDRRVTVAGDVVLILPDISGSSNNTYGIYLQAGIYVPAGASITIYGGPNGGCSLTANGYDDYYAGIGGYRNYTNTKTCGTIRIYGGTVSATGGANAAGIGDSYSGQGGNIIIGGGSVTAKGGQYGSGIGGGCYGDGGNITITGGTITATGGQYAAGIGGGYGGNGGTITISGGTISATGGEDGAGIGGGYDGNGGTITISGGTIQNATGGSRGAGIGGGENGNGGTVLIKNNAKVTANGGSSAAGIGGGRTASGGNVTIEGGELTVKGGNYAAGIGGGYDATGTQNITISGGKVTVSTGKGGSAIGSGESQNSCGKITISGGIVDATAGNRDDSYYTAAIGGRFASGDKITISGGTVTTRTPNSNNSNRYVTGIGAIYGYGNSNIEITGGVIDAKGTTTGRYTGVGIGDGINGTGGKISISITKDGDSVTANTYRGTVTLVTPVKDVTSSPNRDIPKGPVTRLSDINGKKLVRGTTYTITFVNYNGQVLQEGYEVAPGEVPEYNEDTPERDPANEYTYTFSGWKDTHDTVYAQGKALPAAQETMTYTAVYTKNTRYYKVNFYDSDRTTKLIEEKEYTYGTPIENIQLPEKPSKQDEQFTYTFKAWDPQLQAVTKDADYYATYTKKSREYEIKFVNYDGSELATYEVAYGQSPVYSDATPTQQQSQQWDYTFTGWEDLNGGQYDKDATLPAVNGEMTYKAVYNSELRKYSVTFFDEDGETSLDVVRYYDFGTAAENIIRPADPFKDADDEWEYAFAGWTPEIMAVSGNAVYKATYTKTKREYHDLKVAISWIDEDDRDGIRPESYTVEFYTSDLPNQELTFSEENGWSMTLQVPLRDVKGKPISFGFEVTHPDGYSCYVNHPNTFSYVYEFTHAPAKVSLTVQKVWEDAENEFNTRPSELKVYLHYGSKTEEVILYKELGWKDTITGLPKYHDHGKLVEYTWTEDNVPGYVMSGNESDGDVTTITNTLETVTVSGKVTWEMNGYSEDLIPESVTVQILDDGEVVEEITVNRDAAWEFESENLPKYTSDGVEIAYTVDESSVPEGFTESVNGTEIVNTYIPAMTTFEGEIKWNLKGNDKSLIPDSVTVGIYDGDELVDELIVTVDEDEKWTFASSELPKYREDGTTEIDYRIESSAAGFVTTIDGTTITNTLMTVQITGDVNWEMKGYDESLIPANVAVYIKNGNELVETIEVTGDDWTFTSRELPMFEADGVTEVTYTIEEQDLAGFSAAINETTITYTFIPETITISGNVTWNLKGNTEELVPYQVTVLIKDGDKLITSAIASEDDGWNYKTDTLPKYRSDGSTEIDYTVEAEAVDGFISEVSGTQITYTLETVDVTAAVVWNDTNNNDGYRPNQVKVDLLIGQKVVGTATLDEQNQWSYRWTNLPKMVGGEDVVYTVAEEEIEKYDTVIKKAEDSFTYTITNTHENEKVTLRIFVTWDDNENQDGFRPNGLFFNLYKDGEPIDALTVDSIDGRWEVAKKNLTRWNNGELVDYALEFCDDLSEFYEYDANPVPEIDEETGDITYRIAYKHTPETVDLTVVKEWDDNEDQDGYRTDSVTITLYAEVEGSGEREFVEEITLSGENKWKHTWSAKDKRQAGKLIEYSVEETPVDKYDTQIVPDTVDDVTTFTVTNTHVPEVTTVSVEKIWDDSDNREGFRPASVTIILLADGKGAGSVTLDAKNDWKFTWTDLDKFEGGKEIEYTVSETQLANYKEPVIVKVSEDKWEYTVTNGRNYEETEVKVTKAWNDSENEEGFRPESVMIHLKKGDEVIGSVELKATNNWSFAWTKLQKYENGQAINYTVTEEPVEHYETTIAQAANGSFTYLVTNYRTVVKTEASVELIWEDTDNKEGFRPASVTVKLLANGKEAGTATLNADNEWKYTWTELNKFADGEEVEYTVEETQLANYKEPVVVKISENPWVYTVTNGRDFDMTTVMVAKEWDDSDNEEGFRPKSVTINLKKGDAVLGSIELNDENNWRYAWAELQKYENGQAINYTVTENPVAEYSTQITKAANDVIFNYTVKNSRTVEKALISVEKIWDDSDNKEGFRPVKVEVRLLANGKVTGTILLNADNGWTYTANDLNKYADGKEIKYTFEEDQLENYKVPVVERISNTDWIYTITNSRDYEETEVNVVKVWDDSNNEEGFRPASVTVRLLENGIEKESKVLTEADGWKYSWTKLQKYEGGKAINYTVTEDPVENYSTKITKAEDDTFTYTVKNSRTVEKTQVSVEKIWNDTNNKEGFRPASVTVKLLANGKEAGTATLNADNEWKYTWTGLNKFANGEEIVYTVSEAQLANYKEPVIEKVSQTEWAYTVTNSRDYEETEVKVTKVWDDSKNEEGFRPESVTINFIKGTTLVESVELNEKNNWTYSWTKLQKYENGQAINYTVTENPVANYATQITKAADGTFTYTVKNSRTVEKTQVSVEKIWDDTDNKEGFRPAGVTVKLLANGQEAGTATLNVDNEWKYTWTGLNKFEGGEEIEYTVSEAQLANYKAPVIERISETEWAYTITNSRDYEETEVKVTKVWDDSNNIEGFRPKNVTINFKKGNEVVESVELSAANDWSYSWTKLQKYENGKAVNYTVTEDPVENYATQITKAADGTFTYTVKNSRTVEKTQVSVEKIWEDADNQDGYRPNDVTVTLLANGEEVDENGAATLNADGEWKYTWTGLQKYRNGKEVTYTISEETIENYNAPVIEKVSETEWSYTVTNSHKTEKTEAKAQKVWDDADNQDGYRPEFVIVNLLADGEVMDTVQLSEENNWNYIWTKLDKKKAGKDIDYTITEDKVSDEYTAKIEKATDGTFTYTITNSHKPEETEVTVTKSWNDADNQDGYRPDDVTVNLLANDKVIETVKLSEENNWTYTWTKLDKKAGGKNIDYTVSEDKISDKYTTKITKAADGTFTYTVTNSHTPEMITPSVKIVWDDEDNRNGKRPESLVVEFLDVEGNILEELYVSATEWTGTVEEPVAKYMNGGTPVEYHWKNSSKSELPAGYRLSNTLEDGLTTTITISYVPKPVWLKLEVVKNLAGRDWNGKDTFEFTLAADKENPEGTLLPKRMIANATADAKSVTFGEIAFSKRGTYKFTITETKGTLGGISYDTVAKEVVVVVEDDGEGSLYIESVTNDGSVEVTNTYSSVGAIQFTATKVLDGRELKDGEFTFALKNEAGEVLQTATCDKDGKIVFEPIAYTEKDMVVDGKIVASREYTYTISEVKPEGEKYDALIVYDETVKTIKVTLTDDQAGTINIDSKTTAENITFTNVKIPEYEITFVDEDGKTVLKAARKYVTGTKAADIEKPENPSKKEDESFTYEFSGWTPEISDVTADVTYKATYKATAKPGVYFLVGDAPSAQKGDGKGLVMQFKRTVNDAITFDQFDGISVNGKALTKELYSAVKGSVIITVSQEFINSLPDGKNEVTVTFKDGDPVKVSVEILPAQSSETDPTDPAETEEEKNSPKTADTMVYGWMIVLLGISGVTALLVLKRRKEEEEQIGL